MANVKITDLGAYTDPASTDVLPIVDVGADVTKKVSIADLLKNASAGTAAAPGIAFDGDNTGIYSPGADQVAIATGGIGRLFVDSSGKVGLGTVSPENKLHIVGTSATTNTGATILVDDSASLAADIGGSIAFRGTDGTNLRTYGLIRGGKFNVASGAFDGYLAFETRTNAQANTTERLRITNIGNVGIGTASPVSALEIDAAAATSPFIAKINTSEAIRIDSSGKLLVGTSSPSGDSLLQINDDRIRIASSKTPASASDTGTAGEICWDSNYIYVCTATNTWKRAALSTW